VELASLGAAIGSAICYGAGSVLQARGARTVEQSEGVDPRLLARLVRSAPFVFGLGLDTLGFALQLLALRRLPLFVVQTAVASNLAVTAIGAALVLRERLGWREWSAVGAVCGGLALLGISAGSEGAKPVPYGLYAGLAVTLVALLALVLGTRLHPHWARPALLGAGAGLAFGVVALATRAVPSLALPELFARPSLYLAIVGGPLAFLLYATALQAGSVTAATAALVVGETLIPAVVGIALLGDRSRPGTAGLAVAGFVLAVAGSLALSRFGEPEQRS
jgi:drug/metabolite transporter (DMT)-like permease